MQYSVKGILQSIFRSGSRHETLGALPLTVGIDMGLQSGFPMVKSNFPCH